MHFTTERLAEIVGGFSRCKILVIGDLMLDEFLWGKVTRISPEAPVPVLDVQRRALYPGGAANVSRNLASLGAQVELAGVIGEDDPGRNLVKILTGEKIATGSIRASAQRPTTHKTRVCAITRQLHEDLEIEDQQQIVRVDEESRATLDPESKTWLFERLRAEVAAHDAIIIEDYAKGLIDQELVTLVVTEAKKHGKIVSIDPNPNNPFDWSGGTVLKPNRKDFAKEARDPLLADHAGGSGDAAARGGQEAISHTDAGTGSVRRFGRGRHGDCGVHAGAGDGRDGRGGGGNCESRGGGGRRQTGDGDAERG